MQEAAALDFYPQQAVDNYRELSELQEEIQDIQAMPFAPSINALRSRFGSQAAQVWE